MWIERVINGKDHSGYKVMVRDLPAPLTRDEFLEFLLLRVRIPIHFSDISPEKGRTNMEGAWQASRTRRGQGPLNLGSRYGICAPPGTNYQTQTVQGKPWHLGTLFAQPLRGNRNQQGHGPEASDAREARASSSI